MGKGWRREDPPPQLGRLVRTWQSAWPHAAMMPPGAKPRISALVCARTRRSACLGAVRGRRGCVGGWVRGLSTRAAPPGQLRVHLVRQARPRRRPPPRPRHQARPRPPKRPARGPPRPATRAATPRRAPAAAPRRARRAARGGGGARGRKRGAGPAHAEWRQAEWRHDGGHGLGTREAACLDPRALEPPEGPRARGTPRAPMRGRRSLALETVLAPGVHLPATTRCCALPIRRRRRRRRPDAPAWRCTLPLHVSARFLRGCKNITFGCRCGILSLGTVTAYVYVRRLMRSGEH